MKKIFPLLCPLAFLLAACNFSLSNAETIDATLPNSSTPSELCGDWVNGFASMTQIVEAYNGGISGNAASSGKGYKITPDGQNCEAYFLVKSGNAASAIKVKGTIRFDAESTNSRGSFAFLALSGHHKGSGIAGVGRGASQEELKYLSRKFYYRMDGEWLRIEPNGEPNDSSNAFRKSML